MHYKTQQYNCTKLILYLSERFYWRRRRVEALVSHLWIQCPAGYLKYPGQYRQVLVPHLCCVNARGEADDLGHLHSLVLLCAKSWKYTFRAMKKELLEDLGGGGFVLTLIYYTCFILMIIILITSTCSCLMIILDVITIQIWSFWFSG